MPSLDEIRTLTIKATQQGVTETTDALSKLAAANENVAVVSDKSAKSTLSVQNALERHQRSLDAAYRAQQQYAKAESDLGRARDQGLISSQRYNQLLDLAAQKYGQTSVASQAFAKALAPVQAQMVALSAGAGPVGVFLSSLGPWGMAAAVGFGAAEKAFGLMSTAAHEFAAKGRELRDFTDATGLTVDQLKALDEVGASVGLSSDRVAMGIERLTVSLDEMHRGTGKAFDDLYRLNPQLALQMATTRDTGTAITLLAQAYDKLDVSQRNALSRAVMGRQGIDLARLFTQVGAQGGVAAVTANFEAAGRSIDVNLIQRVSQLDIEIDQASKRMRNSLVSVFAEDVLAAELKFYTTLDSILGAIKTFQVPHDLFALVSVMTGPFGWLVQGGRWAYNSYMGAGQNAPAAAAGGPLQLTVNKPSPAANYDPQLALSLWQKQNAILGSAMTLSEQYRQKTLELAAAQDKDKFSTEVRNRAMDAFNLSQMQSVLATHERLGIASEDEIISVRLRELDDLRARGYVRNAADMVLAEQLIRKEARDTADQMQVRVAALPQLKALELEAGRLDKQFDQFSVGSLNNLTSGLADITMGTVSAADGFKNLGNQVLRSLEEMIIKMSVAVPLARAMQSAFGAVSGSFGGFDFGLHPTARGDVFSQGRVIHPFALGGILSDIVVKPTLFPMANGLGLAGEAGPEAVMPLTRASDGRLGVVATGGSSSGGGNVTVNVYNAPAGMSAQAQTSRDSAGNLRVDVALKQMVDDRMTAAATDRGHPFTRRLAQTLGVNTAGSIG